MIWLTMGAEEALEFADNLVFVNTGKHLDHPQRIVLCEFWRDQKRTYQDIADSHGYSETHLKGVGAQLWQLLSEVLGERVTKGTFQAALEQRWRLHQSGKSLIQEDSATELLQLSTLQSDFVGRDRALADLNSYVSQGVKVILIQGEGGLGKTTLARRYFRTQEFDCYLELWMATETQNITPVESVVEEWLRRDFNEQPGREFGINLERLRRKLRDSSQRIGVLIDNLEPALDRQGKFIKSHRGYVDLLRVLADPSVQSVTLITSRERLYESSVSVQLYLLEGLDENAWQQFFRERSIHSDSPILREMCKAYGGNAKAMQIISSAILAYFQRDIEAYWQENSSDLLIERELENLVSSQFNRLQKIDSEAYRLLCRLGGYRYQDVPSVSIEGLSCLLWDVPESQRRRVIRALQDLSLIEARRGQYWLHPMIRTTAIARLRSSPEWEIVNRTVAKFWMQSVEIVEETRDALRALEAYYHYVEIEDFEQAGDVILGIRGNKDVPLGCSFYQLGLVQKIISVITRIIHKIHSEYRLVKLYNILGYSYRLIGCIREALDCHQKAKKIAAEAELDKLKIPTLFNIGLCKMELWEIEDAKFFFDSVCSLAEEIGKWSGYIFYSQCCLAFLNSCLGLKEEAFQLAQEAYLALSTATVELTLWGTEYSSLFLGLTYKNLGDLEKSFQLCQQVILHSEKNHFTQVKAKAISCLAELYREQQDFEKARFHHSEAIALLDAIGANCDLAEAYYQRGLTYQKLGDVEKSQLNFQEAIRLFSEMNAPNQVEKVKGAMESGESTTSPPLA